MVEWYYGMVLPEYSDGTPCVLATSRSGDQLYTLPLRGTDR